MQFHEYRTLRNQDLQSSLAADPAHRETLGKLKQLTSAQWRKFWVESAASKQYDDLSTCLAALGEDLWVDDKRPYYNVWPIAIELARSVELDLPFSSLTLPFNSMLLRFAKGHEPYEVPVAMLTWPRDQNAIAITSYISAAEWNRLIIQYAYDPAQHVEELLARINSEGLDERSPKAYPKELPELLIRLSVFVSLLAKDTDLITPVVLAKDRRKYEETNDPEIKKWLEDRAVRRAGYGFDVCKGLQLQRNLSPHWRNPHLCLFWTGEGRAKPVIKLRSGAVVQRVSMADVPTGYLGPETVEEDVMPDPHTPREPISKSRRFDIMKRDGFRCQLCGASRESGAVLHVDHKIPLAKGGANEDENLWTLCDKCNLGKSDKAL